MNRPLRSSNPLDRAQAFASAAALAALVALAALLALVPAPAAHAQTIVPNHFQDEVVVGTLDLPTASAFLPDGRLVVAEQYTGRLRLIVHDLLSTTDPMGTVANVVGSAEGGLVGVTFDARWPTYPYLYVMATRDSFSTECLWRYRVTGDLAFTASGALALAPTTRYTVLEVPNLKPKHNGGQLRFGPDGMLYVGIGDDETPCQAQDLSKPFGKILRLDVSKLPDGPGGHPPVALLAPPDNPFAGSPDSTTQLVWAYGLRNPFTFQIDAPTGCLYIGDVGNERFEEVDRACTGGMNFGWPFWEAIYRDTVTCATVSDTSAMTAPLFSYPHTTPGFAINAGPLYRTPSNPILSYPADYDGTMLLGDTWKGYFMHIAGAGSTWDYAPPDSGQPDTVHWAAPVMWPTSMNEGPDGALWYTVYYRDTPDTGPGEVHRIVYSAPSTGVGPGPADGALAGLTLAPPRPTPAFGAVDLSWSLPAPARVDVTVWSAAGRIVRRLVRSSGGALSPPGPGGARWDGRDDAGRRTAPGVYFARLDAGPAWRVGRIVLLP